MKVSRWFLSVFPRAFSIFDAHRVQFDGHIPKYRVSGYDRVLRDVHRRLEQIRMISLPKTHISRVKLRN